jgi:hypothetical protein
MTYLSRTAKLGIAAEATASQYTAPVFTVPFLPGATRYSDHITQLYDRTARATDTDTQDIQQGPWWSAWQVTSDCYADWAGFLYRALVGPDTFTPGTSTTFAQPSAAGAASVYLAAPPPAGAVMQLGSGTALEWAQTGTPSGSGPYLVPVTSPVTGLRFGHGAGDPALSRATHVFTQHRVIGQAWPSYSFTSDDGTESLGWPGCFLGEARLQVRHDAWAKLVSKWNGWPPAAAATFTEAETGAQPFAGWSWQVTTAGGTSTRGVDLDLALARKLQVTPACNGYQGPYFIGAGPLNASGSYSAIFGTTADLNLYRQAIQEPAVMTLAQPVLQGGSSIAVTASLTGWTQGEVSLAGDYVTAKFRYSGIANTTDSPFAGVGSVVVQNYYQAAYGP